MRYMFVHYFIYTMYIIVMIMSRDIVSCVICMFFFPCEIINKFIYFSYIDITSRVYGIVLINNDIIDKTYNSSNLYLKPW